VINIDPAATISNGIPTYKIVLQFDQSDDRIKTGMTANIVIINDKHDNALVIPSSAVISKSGESFVLASHGGKTAEIKITKGIESSQGYTEILSGLNEGDKVATFGK
jgi:multidrug efflux pump subunit AcrA (membrane-fusion protein)